MISNWNTGAYGKVFLVRKKATGDLYAMKVIKKSDTLHKNQQKNIKIERDILFSVQNPFVVRLFFTFQNKDYLFWVMEYIQGGSTPPFPFPFPFPSSISSPPCFLPFPFLFPFAFFPFPFLFAFFPCSFPSFPFPCPFPSSIGSYSISSLTLLPLLHLSPSVVPRVLLLFL